MTLDYSQPDPTADGPSAFPVFSYASTPLLGPVPGTPPSQVGREVIELTGNASTGSALTGAIDDSGTCGACCG